MPSSSPLRIACQQILEEDGSFFSVQWADLPNPAGKELNCQEVARRYYRLIRRANLSLIRVAESETGVAFELWPFRHALLRFEKAAPEPEEKNGTVVLKICGGSLVQPGCQNRGELLFRVEERAEGQRVTLQLSGFFPRLLGSPTPTPVRKRLYGLTMGTFHKLLSICFLFGLSRNGRRSPVFPKVTRIAVRSGEDI